MFNENPEMSKSKPVYYYDPEAMPYPPPGYVRQVYYGPPPSNYNGPRNQPIIIFVPHSDPEASRREPQVVPSEDLEMLAFNDKTVRMAFIRKVYGILTVQLLVTFAIVCAIYFPPEVNKFARSPQGFLVAIVLMVVSIFLLCVLACVEAARRSFPTNFILLGFFTLIEGGVVGIIASYYKVTALVIALGACIVVTLVVTIFAFQTKIDFTGLMGFMLVIFVIFFFFGLLLLIIRIPILHMIYAAIGVFLFSIFLVIDTQLLLGGKHRYSLSPEEYIFAALTLYIDIITLFLYMLSLIGACGGNR